MSSRGPLAKTHPMSRCGPDVAAESSTLGRRRRSPCPAANRSEHRNHPGVNIDDVGDEETGAARDIADRGGVNARPGKPVPDVTVRFPAQLSLARRCARRLDLDDNDAAWSEEASDPPQRPDGVSADTDIAVGEQDLIPAALGGEGSEQ